jgi:hypothetical protein
MPKYGCAILDTVVCLLSGVGIQGKHAKDQVLLHADQGCGVVPVAGQHDHG